LARYGSTADARRQKVEMSATSEAFKAVQRFLYREKLRATAGCALHVLTIDLLPKPLPGSSLNKT
jgi:hypothetical protein